MFRTIRQCLREYRTPTIITILFMTGEAIIEAIIPFITARLVDHIQSGIEMELLLKTGLLLQPRYFTFSWECRFQVPCRSVQQVRHR